MKLKRPMEVNEMKLAMKPGEFEIIDQYNGRHRFPCEKHYYEWSLKPGTLDVESNEFLYVLRVCDDDEDFYEVIATFPNPARVGKVTDTTALTLPMRELQLERCPQCGFVRTPKTAAPSCTENAEKSTRSGDVYKEST